MTLDRIVLRGLAASTGLAVALSVLAPASARAGKAFDTDDATGEQLLQYLDHADWHFRYDAAGEIADRKLIQAEGQLIKLATEDANKRVRRAALVALGKCGSAKTVPTAEYVALQDADPGNRKEGLAWIARQGNTRSVPILARALADDPEPGLREKAADVLGDKMWEGAEAEIIHAATEDPEPGVRNAARRALIRLGSPDLRQVLHRIMAEDPEPGVRRDVVELFEKSPTSADRDALVKALDDRDDHVARHAARALARLGDRSVAPILREKALGRSEKVAEDFNEAAGKLGG
jgi:HEAT repeat protein